MKYSEKYIMERFGIVKVSDGYWRTGEHGRAYIKQFDKHDFRIYLANGDYKDCAGSFEMACARAIRL